MERDTKCVAVEPLNFPGLLKPFRLWLEINELDSFRFGKDMTERKMPVVFTCEHEMHHYQLE